MQLAANGEALVSQVQTYDALVNINGYGDVLQTASANALGHTNKQRTDGAGRTIQSIDAENFVTSFQYDANGNRLSVRDGNNVGQDCVYDALNRDKQCADTQELLDNVNRRKVFNLAGQVIQDIDAKNAITSSTYDARGRKISTTDRINATTTFTFDAAGNELSMTDAENQTTSYSYDALNRRLTIQWPDHVAGTVPGDQHYGIQHTAYDAAGRALRKTDQRGDTITLIYDLAGRMLRREYRTLANSTPLEEGLPTGPVADQDVFTYDAASRMLTATKGRYSNTVSFTYDTGGRRATESLAFSGIGFQPVAYTVAYAYDTAGRENEITYPDGTVVQRTFTPRSQLQSVSLTEPGSNTAQSVSTFEYDAGRRETSRTYGNGITTTRSYRADNLVSSINAPAVESLSYTYDANKNPTAELRSGVMAPYSWSTGESGFDAQNRLTNWTRQNGDSQSWQLTAVNDWQSFTNNGVPQQRTHGPTHEILSIDNTPLVHDSRGNLTQDNRGTSMTYDADNMLSVFGANAVEGLRNATYTYDALGRRVSKTVAGATSNDPSTTTLFILANQQVIAEYSTIGTAQPTLASRTAYGSYIDEPLILLSNLTSQIAYYHTNRQYSVYTLTDATGSVLDRIAYTPNGEHYCFTPTGAPRSTFSDASNATLFTGRICDSESLLYYFRSRYFAPVLGRFVSHDPIMYPDGWNTFSGWFAFDDIDPYGECKDPKIGAFCHKESLEFEVGIPEWGWIKKLLKKFGMEKAKAKFFGEIKRCNERCCKHGKLYDADTDIYGTLSYKIELKTAPMKWDIYIGELEGGSYETREVSGSVAAQFSECKGTKVKICITPKIGGGFRLSFKSYGGAFEGGGQAQMELAVPICFQCDASGCTAKANICTNFKAKWLIKVGKKLQYNNEWEYTNCLIAGGPLPDAE